jgi:hypothetical protein
LLWSLQLTTVINIIVIFIILYVILYVNKVNSFKELSILGNKS